MDTRSQDKLKYVDDPYVYRRRKTRAVMIGAIGVGGDNPVRVQSMLTSNTLDTKACVLETHGLVEAGCEIVRITAQTVRHAANLEHIVAQLRAAGHAVPIVADIHFKPDAALEAAKWVEKVRVNPGNYADSKKFAVREYTDNQYAEEIERIRERFAPLVERCVERGVAMRIGTNHGSLSDRIMNRYGDSPLGMVESALEFARIAREMDYHDFVFSMKASNPKVMIEAYRLLVARLNAEGEDWNYPLHLGVTEAGDGEDGRIKSAIGIGSLLADGIGDTIRVSLTEDAVEEVPVCHALLKTIAGGPGAPRAIESENGSTPLSYDPFDYVRRPSEEIEIQGIALGGKQTVRVVTSRKKWDQVAHKLDRMGDFQPEIVAEEAGVRAIDPRDAAAVAEVNALAGPALVTVADGLDLPVIAAFRLLAARVEARHPVLLKDVLESSCGILPQKSAAESRGGELRQDAAATFLDREKPIQISGGTSLPHWIQEGATYAVTFRLEDSLPQSVLNEYAAEKARLETLLDAEKNRPDNSPGLIDSMQRQLEDLYSEKIETALDAGHGACWLRKEDVAQMVYDALQFFDGDRYELIAWAIMPNHVHLVLRPYDGHELSKVLHSLKSYTSNEANKILGRDGTFWQKESFDHLVRDEDDFRNQVKYVLDNPQKAGLGSWPWFESSCGILPQDPAAESRGRELRQDAAATFLDSLLTAGTNIGSLLCDGIGDAVLIQGEEAPGQSLRLAYNVLQAAGARIFKTDYVACPSCGRTLFNLQTTTQKIRAATGHLKGVRIAIMGCIVNGPGEMADADFGYVGGAPGKINLYVGKTPVEFNIPEGEAVARLIDLIAEHGKWVDAPVDAVAAAPVSGSD